MIRSTPTRWGSRLLIVTQSSLTYADSLDAAFAQEHLLGIIDITQPLHLDSVHVDQGVTIHQQHSNGGIFETPVGLDLDLGLWV